jgi:nucleoside-diphosphate-sugar epimerase
VGPGAERLPARIILGRPPLRVRNAEPPVQVVHVDDLAAALVLVATRDLPGTFNVAADGWLAADDARALLPRTSVPAVPAEVLERALRGSWALGVGDIPPGVVPYLVHPWVVANDRLKQAGWAPTRTNETAIAEALTALPRRGPGRARAIGIVVGASAVFAVLRIRRRRKRARGARAQEASG